MGTEQKFYLLRSGVVMPYTRVIPTGAVKCDANGQPLEDEPVQAVDGDPKPLPASFLNEELTETPQVGDLPDGPSLAIIEWVGNDPQRAVQAREAEAQRARPRTSVINGIAHVPEPTEGG